MEKKLGSLFDGIGGFPLAAKRNGIRPVWASEIEKFPIHCQRKEFVICLLLLMMINMTLTQKMEITCMQVFWMHMMNIAHSCS